MPASEVSARTPRSYVRCRNSTPVLTLMSIATLSYPIISLKDQKGRLDFARDTMKRVTVSSAADSGKKKLRVAHDGSGQGSSAVSTRRVLGCAVILLCA